MFDRVTNSIAWQNVLQARAIHIDQELLDATSASNTKSDALDAWIREHSPLLTKEELNFEQKIGVARRDHAIETIADDAFEDAISSLQASVANIEQQCKVLENHKSALTHLRMQHASNERHEALKQNSQKKIKESATFELENDRMAGEMRSELNTSNQDTTVILNNAHNNTNKAFEKDDRILDGLQKIVPRLGTDDNEHLTPEAIDILCERWVSLERQAMRRRIDDAYDEALSAPGIDTDVCHKSVAETRAIRAELTELSGELDGLINLVAEHHYRALINRSIERAREDAEAESAKWSEYTACVLLYLTARLEALHDFYERAHVHKAALAALNAELDDVLATKIAIDVQPDNRRESNLAARGLKPLRLVQATYNDSQDTMSQVLKLLDVRVTAGTDAAQQALADQLEQRSMAYTAALARGNEEHNRLAAKSHHTCRQHFVALSQAIEPSASVGAGSLVEADLQTALGDFQARTDDLAKRMQAVDVDSFARGMINS